MKSDAQTLGGEGGENLLALSQRISEEDGDRAAVNHTAAPGNHVANYLAGVGKTIVRLAEGALQQQHVRGNGFGRRAGESAAGFEISGIEDATEIGLHQRLR